MKIRRREFLTRTALGLGSALLAPQLLAETKPAPKFFDPYERVALGKTKLKVKIVEGENPEVRHTWAE